MPETPSRDNITTVMDPPLPPWRHQALGLLLFSFIPLVLWLYVGHPEPIALSATAGILLMLGHRFVARPYMRRVAGGKCLWCNRMPPRDPARPLPLAAGGGAVAAVCCPGHHEPAARFFAFAHRWRWPLRLGIFLPLLLLLSALAAAALGHDRFLRWATDLFRLVVGLTVHLAAWGCLFARPAAAPRVPFPVHNFFLLGVRALVWIVRIVGIWWIWRGASGLFGGS